MRSMRIVRTIGDQQIRGKKEPLTTDQCPFCFPASDRIFYQDHLVIGIWDAFPVNPGHALLITRRHIRDWFEASNEERIALTRAVEVARFAIAGSFKADGYNIGINVGEAAGQTVFHLHLHVIPRVRGDVEDPRGGVRHVIPRSANYLASIRPWKEPSIRARALFTGGTDPLLPHLIHHLAESISADIAVAFTMRSGLDLLSPHLQDLLDRKGSLRVLTGDYLGTTDPDALLRLLDLNGDVDRRVFETERTLDLEIPSSSFHPKAYIFRHRDGSLAAFIGSSNLSGTALTSGIEWNYRAVDAKDPQGIAEAVAAFGRLFTHPNTVALTASWIEHYRARRPTAGLLPAPIEVVDEGPPVIPAPHSIQAEALRRLAETRVDGRLAGLVVLATGLGKTWLSAFDSTAYNRVLFVAHREEILTQALETFRRIRPHDVLGRYTGEEKTSSANVLFASIQTLSRQSHLERFARDEFDYIIVDEFHHAEARTYRRLIEHFTPKFLLGLTATPERTDGADLLTLCDNNLVYRCDLVDGIRADLLCPFKYFGVPDLVDYRNIPWRNKRFDEDELTKAVVTQARARNALEQYRTRAGKRTLAFCVSMLHADFMAQFFCDNGIAAVSVHSGPTSAPRADSLQQLKDGSLAVICAVDMFNEGVDVPELDTVMMLRPTESRIVWLQQFGRGLRRTDRDKKLAVIDYIGNHRAFLLKPQALFGLPPGDHAILNLLERLESGSAELPPGCEVTYELEVKDILRSLLRQGSAIDTLRRRYQDFVDTFGVRPTALELFQEGYNPRVARPMHGSWLGFVMSQSGFSDVEKQAYERLGPFLDSLEVTEMSRSYKMVVLTAMLNRGVLPGKITLPDLVAEVSSQIRRDRRVEQDFNGTENYEALAAHLRKNPIDAWIGGKGTGGARFFSYIDAVFKSEFDVAEPLVVPAQELIREIVEWRTAEYFERSKQDNSREFVLKVSHAGDNPILFLPDRTTHPDLPEGWTEVRINEEVLLANFVKIALNVVQAPSGEENELPGILRGWFGDDVGKPGTRHQVILKRETDGWLLRPSGTNVVGIQPYRRYRRDAIPNLFGLPYSERAWGQGFVRQGNTVFLFVTLDKTGHEEAFQYKDHFISPAEFEWQSQNRTTQKGDHGQLIRFHRERGAAIHLFVRSKAKTREGKGESFLYCGPVEFESWSGENPITVRWKLSVQVPSPLWTELNVPHS
jgi:superfamily II DNA or RNA helicase/HKD family nuclease/diadenosine tetraphosphate (Ap4A) HIT family hydrolase